MNNNSDTFHTPKNSLVIYKGVALNTITSTALRANCVQNKHLKCVCQGVVPSGATAVYKPHTITRSQAVSKNNKLQEQ